MGSICPPLFRDGAKKEIETELDKLKTELHNAEILAETLRKNIAELEAEAAHHE